MRVFTLTLALGLSIPVAAQPTNCASVPDRLTVLVTTPEFDRVAKAFDANPDFHPIQFIALDHRSRQWSIYEWRRRANVPPQPSDFVEVTKPEFAENGVPKVALGRNDRAFFLLTNTTPPLYTLKKETTPHDTPELANLKQMLAGLETLVTLIAQRRVAVNSNFIVLNHRSTSDVIADVKAKLLGVRAIADRVEDAKKNTIRLLQYSELGETSPSVDAAAIGKLVSEIGPAYRALETSYSALVSGEFGTSHGCQAVLDIVKEATKDDFASATAISDMQSRLVPKIEQADCSDEARAEAIAALDTAAHQSDYVNTTSAHLALIAIVKQTLGTETNVLTNAAAVRDVYAGRATADPCDYISGVLLGDNPDQITFDKFGEVKVTITKKDVLGNAFTRRPNAEGDFTYRTVNPVGDRIGFGVAMTLSGIRDPEFKAVQNPNNAAEKVIGKSSEKRRAGEIALLGVYRWTPKTHAIRHGFQFGVGTSKTLELFAGYSVDLGSMFRLGVGVTGQQVNGLAHGQHALQLKPDGTAVESSLTKVSADTDIQTRSKLKTGIYFSFSFSLDSLSLFQKPAQ